MTTKRISANRRNALKSTGPRTEEGKARASLNALKHGLRASSLALPYLENAEDWESHRLHVVQDLGAVGYLETILSERVAALLWRLGRVVRYETDSASSSIQGVTVYHEATAPEDAEARAETISRVYGLKPKAHVTGPDVGIVLDLVAEALEVDLSEEKNAEAVECPEDFPGGYWGDFNGWTREDLEKAVQSIKAQAAAEYSNSDPWGDAIKEANVFALTAKAENESRAVDMENKRRGAALPEGEILEKVSRYETALERSLFRTLHELQRLQAVRGGMALPPPAAVDVDISAG
jgi:hypothetical protein